MSLNQLLDKDHTFSMDKKVQRMVTKTFAYFINFLNVHLIIYFWKKWNYFKLTLIAWFSIPSVLTVMRGQSLLWYYGSLVWNSLTNETRISISSCFFLFLWKFYCVVKLVLKMCCWNMFSQIYIVKLLNLSRIIFIFEYFFIF